MWYLPSADVSSTSFLQAKPNTVRISFLYRKEYCYGVKGWEMSLVDQWLDILDPDKEDQGKYSILIDFDADSVFLKLK